MILGSRMFNRKQNLRQVFGIKMFEQQQQQQQQVFCKNYVQVWDKNSRIGFVRPQLQMLFIADIAHHHPVTLTQARQSFKTKQQTAEPRSIHAVSCSGVA